jgi:hypothetical protein
LLQFTFVGEDECEEVGGDGWVKYDKSQDVLNGLINFHMGDSSYFAAKKI